MAQVRLVSLFSKNDVLALTEGDNIIGRGVLGISTKKCSRKQANLHVKDGVVTYTVLGMNRSTINGTHVLAKGSTRTLKDKDEVFLLVDQYPVRLEIPGGRPVAADAAARGDPTKKAGVDGATIQSVKANAEKKTPRRKRQVSSESPEVAEEWLMPRKKKQRIRSTTPPDDLIDAGAPTGDTWVCSVCTVDGNTGDTCSVCDAKKGALLKKEDTPPCIYWDECYQTNPQHLKKFKHPDNHVPSKKKDVKDKPRKPRKAAVAARKLRRAKSTGSIRSDDDGEPNEYGGSFIVPDEREVDGDDDDDDGEYVVSDGSGSDEFGLVEEDMSELLQEAKEFMGR